MPPLPLRHPHTSHLPCLQHSITISSIPAPHEHIITYYRPTTPPLYDPSLENFLAFLIAGYLVFSLFSLVYLTLLLTIWVYKKTISILTTFLHNRTMLFGLHSELRFKDGNIVEVLVKKRAGEQKWENAEWRSGWENVDRWIPVPVPGKMGVHNEFRSCLARHRNRTT